jgi:hypothetical protein
VPESRPRYSPVWDFSTIVFPLSLGAIDLSLFARPTRAKRAVRGENHDIVLVPMPTERR